MVNGIQSPSGRESTLGVPLKHRRSDYIKGHRRAIEEKDQPDNKDDMFVSNNFFFFLTKFQEGYAISRFGIWLRPSDPILGRVRPLIAYVDASSIKEHVRPWQQIVSMYIFQLQGGIYHRRTAHRLRTRSYMYFSDPDRGGSRKFVSSRIPSIETLSIDMLFSSVWTSVCGIPTQLFCRARKILTDHAKLR